MFICKKWNTEMRSFLFSAFYFKQESSQMWERTLKYYDINLKFQYKAPVEHYLVR